MTQASLAIAVCVEAAELECVLWAACASACAAAGDEAVRAIALSISGRAAQDVELQTVEERDAAVALLACASFVATLASGNAAFILRESRVPTPIELVREVRDVETPVEAAVSLARAFLAQRSAC